MSKQRFVRDLIDLLLRIDRGMLEFEDPPPIKTGEKIVAAVAAFGKDILPLLHQTVDEQKHKNTLTHLIDVLGIIGDPSSVPYLIELHDKFSSYDSGAAAIQALRQIGTEDAYLYLNGLFFQHLVGDMSAFNTRLEVEISCRALGEWTDERAIPNLRQAVHLVDPLHVLPRIAIEQLARYPQEHTFLNELANENSELRDMIKAALEHTDQ